MRIYINGNFEYYTDETDTQNTISIMDDKSRIASIRIGAALGDTTPAIKYVLDNNPGSSMVLLDENGTLVNQEEYYPFGETSFGSYAKKRYRYCGKEKDSESGFYYYGARYYASWLCRFVSVDPLAEKYAHLSPYNYASNNPVTHKDVDGMQNPKEGQSPQGGSTSGAEQKGQAANNTTKNTKVNNTVTTYFGFFIRHPIAAISINDYHKGGTNISSVATRFAESIGLKENNAREGSQANAFRHALWQAAITVEYSKEIATEAGNVHEENPFALNGVTNPNNLVFSNRSSADQSIDLLNNIIGRQIGTANPKADTKELAQKTLDYFRNKGLWMASKQENGSFKISQVKLSKGEYMKVKADLQSRNNYGYNTKEWSAKMKMKQKARADFMSHPKIGF